MAKSQAGLKYDEEWGWWSGWIKVPALAAIAIDEGLYDECVAEGDEADPELEKLSEDADALMAAFTNPEAIAAMMQQLRPGFDLDAAIRAVKARPRASYSRKHPSLMQSSTGDWRSRSDRSTRRSAWNALIARMASCPSPSR